MYLAYRYDVISEGNGRKTRYHRVGTPKKSLQAAINLAKKYKDSYVEKYGGKDSGKIVFMQKANVRIDEAA